MDGRGGEMNERDFETKDVSSIDDVLEFYDEYASSWDNPFEPGLATRLFHRQRWDSFMRMFLSESGPRGIINFTAVELGCGTGVYAKDAYRIFSRVQFVDGSQKMLDQLKAKLPKAETVLSCVTRMPIESNSVDVVYWFGLIEHILDRPALFSEVSHTAAQRITHMQYAQRRFSVVQN